jgi:DNA-binding transcriptional ArsR family regulator
VSNLSAADAVLLEEACATIAATPARLRTLRVVMDGGDVTAKDVMDALGLTRSAVGYHLAALTEAGMIHERRATHPRGRGPIIYWSADREAIHGLRDTLAKHLT